MKTLFFIIVVVIIFVIRFYIRNTRADNLLKQFNLPLEDRVFLMKEYGPSGLNKWVIQQYIQEKSNNSVVKKLFIDNFQALTSSFNLLDKVYLKYSEADNNVLEVQFKCQKDDISLKEYLDVVIFNKDAYNNLKNMGITKIVFMDVVNHEYEDSAIDKLAAFV